MTQTPITLIKSANAKTAPRGGAAAESLQLRKRIGSTTFHVHVRFSDTSTETLADKVRRLVDREVEQSA